ncbi:MAG: xanthine dehydrogenase family protein molybdopterin-binding subunit [Betaproteobacteria bacterium]|nr:xanthine dehydrogenase family protein molybdopterin-binding subunit [Betaproteobacteria bacterium]
MNSEIFKNSRAVITNISRRDMLKGIVSMGGLVVAGQILPRSALAAWETGAGGMTGGVVWDPHVYVSIDADGIVTIVTHRSEMGTGSRTSLPMVVADEMEADWSKVRITQAPGNEKKYGNQDTDGSRSIRHFVQPMRACGAAARQMLEQAAALAWGCPISEVKAKNHKVVHTPSGKSLGYGELAEAASRLPTPKADTLVLKDPKDFRYIGKGKVKITDMHDITTGKAMYAQDISVPGMKYAVIARPPVVLGKAVSWDAGAAMKVPGVTKVLFIAPTPMPAKFAPLGGVAVVANSTYAAIKGREALNVVWEDGPNGAYDSDQYKALLAEKARAPGKIERNEGDIDKAIAGATKVIEREYYIPHFSHATMEPPAAVARVNGGTAEVWACVQSPGGTRGDVAALLGFKEDDVTVNVTLLGGGFGRKSKCDFALEAALLSREMNGVPVKVVWTREDDIRHAFYHAVSYQHVTAAIDKNKKVVGWRHRSVAPSLMSNFMPDPNRQSNLELGLGLIDTPFDVPNLRLETGEAKSHARIGWFRSVNNIPHAFAMQSMVAELAHELGRDPKDFLLEMIGPPRIVDPRKTVTAELWNYGDPYDTYPVDTARTRRVVELAASKAGWGRKLPAGRGLGIAVQRSFLTYVATVVEVAVDKDGNVSVPRVDTAIDCGFVVNPERIQSQIEGAAVMGLSIAKLTQITFKKGRVQQSNFHDYQVLRIGQGAMDVRTHIVPATYDVPSSGVGEPGVPPFAPAFCNAVFAATGKRIRNLPLGDQLST